MDKYSYSKKPKKKPSCLPDGRNLNILAAATANVLADNFTCEELGVLAIFFRVLSESIVLVVSSEAVNKSSATAIEDILL